jgi:hypothetical protein
MRRLCLNARNARVRGASGSRRLLNARFSRLQRRKSAFSGERAPSAANARLQLRTRAFSGERQSQKQKKPRAIAQGFKVVPENGVEPLTY